MFLLYSLERYSLVAVLMLQKTAANMHYMNLPLGCRASTRVLQTVSGAFIQALSEGRPTVSDVEIP